MLRNTRSIIRWTLAAVVVVLVAIYGYFCVPYRSATWPLTGPNQILFDGRTYRTSSLPRGVGLPPTSDAREYVQIDTISPLKWKLYGLADVDGQMNIYLYRDGEFAAYGIEGGPP